jgi:hypothetical protein
MNVRLAGVAIRVAGATPLPDRAISTEVLDPFKFNERVPLLLPAACGAKRTAKVVLWFGARVNGKPRPVKMKPVPVIVAVETVRSCPPEFFKVSVCD